MNSPLCFLTFQQFPCYACDCLLLPVETWSLTSVRKACALPLLNPDLVKGRQKNCTDKAIVADRLCVSVCLCECFCETESVWGHAEWETYILFGHTADSHSPYSPTLTFWNGVLDSDCSHCSGLINQSQLLPPSFCHQLGSTWLPRFTRYSADKYISVILLLLLSPLAASSAPLRLITSTHSLVGIERERKTEKWMKKGGKIKASLHL